MPRLFLNTYGPLATTPEQNRRAAGLGLPPFIDGSIRREPDLQHERPSITCLCRGRNFAPRLREDDIVVYMTKRGTYGTGARHWRMTAALRVDRLFESHAEAAAWYRAEGMSLPSNCMVKGNRARPVLESNRCDACNRREEAEWDQMYLDRSRACGRFVVCEKLWSDLSWSAPQVTTEDMHAVFRRVPGTRTPGVLPIDRFETLMKRVGIRHDPNRRDNSKR